MADTTNEMPVKTKTARGRSAGTHIELIVRRGAGKRYENLKRKTEHLPVEVVWDRRKQDRRGASQSVSDDRRKTDRRQKPPFTWELSDFVLREKKKGSER
jgi:hypothetical protein